jgi:uncharacterized integral membrane protein
MKEDDGKKRADFARKLKIGLLILVGVVAIIFLLSNLKTMRLAFLFGALSMDGPIAFFIFVFILIGFVLGFGACLYWLRLTRGEDGETDEDGEGEEKVEIKDAET